ncbi:peptidylprolyl isomerase [Cumulibacter manganitolerans]|uniref:peptidylprolyl isomerase n=1 Tax=Cumulibacter manganitolerans TaxID=1884992 RepID=UPI001297D744|nr:peptidylprolyl isomerase [Cumulibacter manganitolerans]
MSTAKQRRAAAHRKLEAQIAARKEAERQRKQQMIILSLVAAVAVIGLVTWMAVSSTDSAAKKAANACGYAADGSGEPTVGLPSADGLKKTGTVDLGMSTNRGEIKMRLDRAGAPCAVNSFAFLAEAHFFDGTPCHRLTTGALGVLQCGDPTGSGSGGAGYHFSEEPPTSADPYPEGTVAMAKGQAANSTGSQFFICYKSCSDALGPEYSVVGKVTEGLDVVKAIAAEGTSNGASDGAPKNPVTITNLAVIS